MGRLWTKQRQASREFNVLVGSWWMQFWFVRSLNDSPYEIHHQNTPCSDLSDTCHPPVLFVVQVMLCCLMHVAAETLSSDTWVLDCESPALSWGSWLSRRQELVCILFLCFGLVTIVVFPQPWVRLTGSRLPGTWWEWEAHLKFGRLLWARIVAGDSQCPSSAGWNKSINEWFWHFKGAFEEEHQNVWPLNWRHWDPLTQRTASHPRRHVPSVIPVWQPKISHVLVW